ARNAIARVVSNATTALDVTTAHVEMTTPVAVMIPAATADLHGGNRLVRRVPEAPVLEANALTVVAQVLAQVIDHQHAAGLPRATQAELSQAPVTIKKMSFKSATKAQASVRRHTTPTVSANWESVER
ncbi:MAG: hypothetical protein WD400_01185, partial [Pontimonas sp.]